MEGVKHVIIDFETTGKYALYDYPTQFAALFPDNSTYETLIQTEWTTGKNGKKKPKKYIPKVVQELTGITSKMIMDESLPTIKQVLEAFTKTVVEKFPSPQVWIWAHNGKIFDFQLYRRMCGKWKVPIPNNWLFVDSLLATKEAIPNYEMRFAKLKLEVMASTLNYDKEQTHQALDDCWMLKHVIDSLDLPNCLGIEGARNLDEIATTAYQLGLKNKEIRMAKRVKTEK